MPRKKKRINNSGIPDYAIESIARCILPEIMACYQSAEGRREFAKWKALQDEKTKDKKDDCGA